MMATEIEIGNDHFVNEDFQAALDAYSRGLEQQPNHADLLSRRAACHLKLKNFASAESDAEAAIAADPSNVQGHLRLGIASFSLQNFGRAKEVFERGLALSSQTASQSSFADWLQKTTTELQRLAPPSAEPAPAPAPAPASSPAAEEAPTNDSAIELLPQSTYRRDWFQSPTHVSIDLFARDTKPEAFSLKIFSGNRLSLVLSVNPRSEYRLDLTLCEPVVAHTAKVEHLKSKIAIRLEKTAASHWKSLEGGLEDCLSSTAWFADESDTPAAPGTPPPTKAKKDWDKIAASVEEEKPSGDAALNKVFQDIYSKGSEEQRRAMIKSFTESGGTVLSTNWEDVGARKVEITPPKGLEARSWAE